MEWHEIVSLVFLVTILVICGVGIWFINIRWFLRNNPFKKTDNRFSGKVADNANYNDTSTYAEPQSVGFNEFNDVDNSPYDKGDKKKNTSSINRPLKVAHALVHGMRIIKRLSTKCKQNPIFHNLTS